MNKKSTETHDLGRRRLVKQLARRITRHCRRGTNDAVDKSLVIGIFGEWGSGKSWILKELEQSFRDEKQRLITVEDDTEILVLPILFNPWRFEAEEHLVVPLLMTVHEVLRKQSDLIESFSDKLKNGAEYFRKATLAFASAWKFKIGLLGLGSCDFDPDKALKAQNAMLQEDRAYLDSCYYDFENRLKEVTSGQLKLLFLIDDIDRCLPERAVQMLEAIKLFLDVPECVFVLGVDDEVVERGIRHRYRDYNREPDTTAANSGGQTHHLPPITGMEYLEKIIHLPVRLPLMHAQQVKGFLEVRYPDLFMAKGETESGAQESDKYKKQENEKEVRGDSRQSEALLELFTDAVPPIPRKLLRAAELLDFLSDLPEPHHFQPDKLFLARLVLLQLFAPAVFRHLRRVNHWLIQVMAEWQERTENKKLTSVHLEYILDKKITNAEPAKWESEERPLLKELLDAGLNRVNFDPCKVIQGLESSSIPDNLLDYFHLVSEKITSTEVISESIGITGRLEQARLSDPERFIAELFVERKASWRKALDFEELQNKVVDDDVFNRILAKLSIDLDKQKNSEWLGLLAMRLDRHHQDNLDHKYKWRNQLLSIIQDSKQEMGQRHRYGLLLGNTGWLPDDLDLLVRIPKGDFIYGKDKKPGNIRDDYWIGGYPVTNTQFKRFYDAGGYNEGELWTHKGWEWVKNEKRKQPVYWGNKKFNNPIFPVVGVTWFEALAYCRWLDQEVQQQPGKYGIPMQALLGRSVMLPTNNQWERAARGTDGREFPWGGDKPDFTLMNVNDSWGKDEKNKSTTAVITFKNGVKKMAKLCGI